MKQSPNSHALDIVANALETTFRKRENISIVEWCEKYVELPPAVARPGLVSFEGSRYLIRPLMRCGDYTTREVNIKFPTRHAKSLIANLVYCWSIVNLKVPFLHVFHDGDTAFEHCNERVWPMLDRNDWYRPYRPVQKTHRRIMDGTHANGVSFRFCGSAPGRLQSNPACIVVADEIWQWKAGSLSHARARMGDFEPLGLDKLITMSQGGAKYCDDWRLQYASGTVCNWMGICDGCGKPMPLVWMGTREDRSKYGVVFESKYVGDSRLRSIDRAVETVRFVCKHCGHEHTSEPAWRKRLDRYGDYYHERESGELVEESNLPDSKISFHITAMMTVPLQKLVEEWIEANNRKERSGSYEDVHAFIEKRLAEETTDFHADQPEILLSTGEEITIEEGVPSWSKAKYRAMGIDTQKDHYWAVVLAFSEAGEIMVLFAGRLETMREVDETRRRFGVPYRATGQDVGWNASTVLADIAKEGEIRNGRFLCWYGTMGRDYPRGWTHAVKSGKSETKVRRFWNSQSFEAGFGRTRKQNPKLFAYLQGKGIEVFQFDSNTYRTILNRLHIDSQNGKTLYFHESLDAVELGRHLAADVSEICPRTKRVKWSRKGGRPNHLADCMVIALMIGCAAGWVSVDQQN